jgi:LemA protein
MQKKRYALWIAGGIIILLFIFAITTYNSLVNKEEKVNQQWAEVQNTYQRRLDLVPNLVNVVKGISGFEQGTLEKIATARSNALAGRHSEITAANYNQERILQDSLAAAANRLIVTIEKYPVLKGTDAYAGLQTQLEGTERRIKVARNDFNEAVATYNKKARSFPSSLVAGIFGFKKIEGFEAVTGAENSVEIKF